MHITITGNLGSGKSTICKLLQEKYQFEIYSTGKVQRELASQMNMTTLELNQLMRSDPKYDKMIDDATTRISRENKDKNIIFDSRLAWHFVEQSFKVFVSVSLEVAANRVMRDARGEVEKYGSIEEAKKLLAERAATECVRYKEIYDLNYMDFTNYDLIIDSTYCGPEQISEIVMKEAKKFEAQELSRATRMLIPPQRLIKEHTISEEDQIRLAPLITEYSNGSYTIETVLKVKKPGEDYEVVDGVDHAKAAFMAKTLYVPVMIIKD